MAGGKKIKTEPKPKHVGFILDGNRRWAVENGLAKFEGHRHGYETIKRIAEACIEQQIPYVTAFVFSTENWHRPPREVRFLLDLLYWVATSEIEQFNDKNVRVVFLGSEERLDPKIIRAIRQAEELTKDNTGLTLTFCLNYGGQQEIADAVKSIVESGQRGTITPELVRQHLYHPEIPDIDLIIRTSGEQRLSNFMLWRSAYAELYFCAKKHWPAFTVADLKEALVDYGQRMRRFGQ